MRFLTKENIILALICLILFFKGCDYFNINDSDRELKEQIYLDKIRSQDHLIKLSGDSINKIIQENENIKKNRSTDSLNIWNADRKYRDSIRSIINPR